MRTKSASILVFLFVAGCVERHEPTCSRAGDYYTMSDSSGRLGFPTNEGKAVESWAIVGRRGLFYSEVAQPLYSLAIRQEGEIWKIYDTNGSLIVATSDELCGDAITNAVANAKAIHDSREAGGDNIPEPSATE